MDEFALLECNICLEILTTIDGTRKSYYGSSEPIEQATLQQMLIVKGIAVPIQIDHLNHLDGSLWTTFEKKGLFKKTTYFKLTSKGKNVLIASKQNIYGFDTTVDHTYLDTVRTAKWVPPLDETFNESESFIEVFSSSDLKEGDVIRTWYDMRPISHEKGWSEGWWWKVVGFKDKYFNSRELEGPVKILRQIVVLEDLRSGKDEEMNFWSYDQRKVYGIHYFKHPNPAYFENLDKSSIIPDLPQPVGGMSEQIIVARSPETVWRFFIQIERWKDWIGFSFKSVDWKVGGRMNLEDGGFSIIVQPFDPLKKVHYYSSGAFTTDTTFDFEPFEEGRKTRIVFTQIYSGVTFRDGGASKRESMQETLTKLKGLVEKEPERY